MRAKAFNISINHDKHTSVGLISLSGQTKLTEEYMAKCVIVPEVKVTPSGRTCVVGYTLVLKSKM